ncbi:MAG: hypothetical protein AB2693_23670 [Candidatus Thiodiazotropha sp.]
MYEFLLASLGSTIHLKMGSTLSVGGANFPLKVGPYSEDMQSEYNVWLLLLKLFIFTLTDQFIEPRQNQQNGMSVQRRLTDQPEQPPCQIMESLLFAYWVA